MTPGASHSTAFVQFQGCQGSQAGLRHDSEAINGQLKAFLWQVRKPQTWISGLRHECLPTMTREEETYA